MRRMSSTASIPSCSDDDFRECVKVPISYYGEQIGKISGRPVVVRQQKKRHIVNTVNVIGEVEGDGKEQACAQTVEGIETLYNFVSAHLNNIVLDDKHEIKMLERLSGEVLEKIPGNSLLHKKLIEHGWNGMSYICSSASSNFTSLHEVLATLCISRSVETYSDDASIIKSFCPDRTIAYLDKLTHKKHAHIRVQNDSFYGTCMLADISGFTKLSGNLCMKGSAGLDDLHKATNGFLGKLAHIVYSHGGDVVAFAGDALICIFIHQKIVSPDPSSEHSSTTLQNIDETGRCDVPDDNPVTALRALKCAIAIKSHCTQELTSHIALSCGNMTLSTLGGFNNQWVFLLNGSPIPELGSCITDAKSKDVVITEKLYKVMLQQLKKGESLDAHIVSSNVLSGNRFVRRLHASPNIPQYGTGSRIHRISDSKVALSRMKKFIPPPVLKALSTGSYTHISELRQVTTMFMKLDGYTCPLTSQEDALSLEVLQNFFHMAQIVLYKFGGFMRQFLVDDKGCVLIAMWGMPMYNHSDNCAKAVEASVSLMQRAPSILNYPCSIGITTGSVFCSTVGSVERRDYVGIGAKVNLAARLMCKANGRILMDSLTYTSVANSHLVGSGLDSESFCLKGVASLVAAYICPVPPLDDNEVLPDTMQEFKDTAPVLGEVVPLSTPGGVSEKTNSYKKTMTSEEYIEKIIFLRKPIAAEIRAELSTFLVGDQFSAAVDHNLASQQGKDKENAKIRRSDSVEASKDGEERTPSRNGSGMFAAFFTSPSSPPPMKKVGNVGCNAYFFVIKGPVGCGDAQAKRFIKEESMQYAHHFINIRGKVGDDVAPYGVFKRLLFKLLKLEPYDSNAKEADALCALFHCLKLDGLDRAKVTPALRLALMFDWQKSKPKDENSTSRGNRMYNYVNNLLGIQEEEELFSIRSRSITSDQDEGPSRTGSGKSTEFQVASHHALFDDHMVCQAVVALLRYRNEYDYVMKEFGRAKLAFSDDVGRQSLIDRLLKRNVVLPDEQRYSILVEGAHFCDELTWNEFCHCPTAVKQSTAASALKLKFFLLMTSSSPVSVESSGQHADPGQSVKYASLVSLESVCKVRMLYPLVTEEVRLILEYFMYGKLAKGIDEDLSDKCNKNHGVEQRISRNVSARMKRRESISSNLETFGGQPEEPSLSYNSHRNGIMTGDTIRKVSSDSVRDSPSISMRVKSATMMDFFMKKPSEVVPEVKYNLEPSYEDYFAEVPYTVTDLLVSEVLAVSQGNYYWCYVIAAMIQKRGIEFFLKAVGLKSLVNDVDNEGSSTSLKESGGNPLHALVICQVDKLHYRLQMVLKYASVIGEEFYLDTLTAIIPLSMLRDTNSSTHILPDALEKETMVHEHLLTLVDRNLISLAAGDEGSHGRGTMITPLMEERREYAFRTVLIRNAVYELVPAGEASSLHELVAQHIIGSGTLEAIGNLQPVYASLSYHYSLCIGRREDAFRYGLKGADECVRCGAFSDFFVQIDALIKLVKTQNDIDKVVSSLNVCMQHLKTHVKSLNARALELGKKSTFRSFFSMSGRQPIDCEQRAEALDDNNAIVLQYQRFLEFCEATMDRAKSSQTQAMSYTVRAQRGKNKEVDMAHASVCTVS